MNNFKNITDKLQEFTKKFYLNELIKGVILFISFGLLYLIFTLFVEYLFWLIPLYRTILFWFFVFVEVALLYRFILIPAVKLIGLKQGLSTIEASRIIGNHFPEVNDKLLNVIQLHENTEQSELLLASIEQKSIDLQPIPFKKAINLSKNRKYLKYAILPFIIWLLVWITGNISIFNNSLTRVVQHNTQFEPPAPFYFDIKNSDLQVIEGKNYKLSIETLGSIIPEDVKIFFNNESYYLNTIGLGLFEYRFSNVKESVDFYFEANDVVSKTYTLKTIPTPLITNLKMVLKYPGYTGKSNEVIQNTGNAVVPQGTDISWQITTHQTNEVSLINDKDIQNFEKSTNDYFSLTKRILKPFNYKITSSNSFLKNHESLSFSIDVVPDEFPKISVSSDIDSISYGPVQFVGQASDDYGIRKLQLVYYNNENPSEKFNHRIEISKGTFNDFYYIFPDEIDINEGVNYEMYFEVFDNDAVNGSKRTKSKVFTYYNKTQEELKEELLNEQKTSLNKLSKSIDKSKKSNSELEKFKEELQKKADFNWNDAKKLDEFLKRQRQYQEMFQEQTEKLENSFKQTPNSDELEEKKEAIGKRIEEAKKLTEQDKLLKELEELTDKLKKEDLLDKLKELSKKNKRNEANLERILELTKRFYTEQKATQIQEKLEQLSEEQEEEANKSSYENSQKNQEEINKKFDEIKEDFKELEKQNNDLQRPMSFPDSKDDQEEIDENLDDALDKLNNERENEDNQKQNSKSAKKSQRKAASKMKQLAKKMGQSMAASEGEEIDENIDDLRIIVENLIEFSFQQEALMNKFSTIENSSATYPQNIKNQNKLKEYFEHIDDSLYMLSLRVVQMSSMIQDEVSDIHYNMDESLLNFTENRYDTGLSNQQFVITGTNNLANSLSDLLENLMNASPSMGKGKGKSKGFSLPDIIQKQGEISEKMKQQMQKGEKSKGEKGEQKGEEGESQNEELFEIYKEQAELRKMLQDLLGKEKGKNKGSGQAEKMMEEIEDELLEKGVSNNLIEKIKQLNYELLKLDEAKLEQGEDKERESNTNKNEFQDRIIKQLKLKKPYFNNTEILNRQSLPLRTIYKKKVQEYFKSEQ